MPATFEMAFVVRQYECDAFGRLQPAHCVRWMQEAALGATAAVGWTMERYAACGTQWVIRETQLEVSQPVGYGARVSIRTWIDDFRKVRSYRRYEFRCEGALIARAVTDWVYMDVQTSKPRVIPSEMIADFRPEGSPPSTPRAAFAAPTVDHPLYQVEQRVAWGDIDVQGHANNAAYVAYIEDAFQHGTWREGMRLAALHVQYVLPARFAEEVDVAVYEVPANAEALRLHYRLHRHHDGVLIAQANGVYVRDEAATRHFLPRP